MRHYKNMAIWENRKSVRVLLSFRDHVIGYFTSVKSDFYQVEAIETQDSSKHRLQINLSLREAAAVVDCVGVSRTMFYTPPPLIGGFAGDIDLFQNIFRLSNMKIEPRILIDMIERAIGIYETDRVCALRRTCNPFFWFGRLLEFVSSIPFLLLGSLGFDRGRMEASLLGRLLKRLVYLLGLLASFITVLRWIGWLDELETLLGQVAGLFE